jgi:hypothetical protein
MRTKKNSKRGQVRAVYEKSGEAKAIEKGGELGVRPPKVRRWIRIWTRDKPRAPEPERQKRRRKKAGRVEEGDMVCMTWNADLVAKLVEKGPEQSVIKFANGNTRVVVNEWMAPAD